MEKQLESFKSEKLEFEERLKASLNARDAETSELSASIKKLNEELRGKNERINILQDEIKDNISAKVNTLIIHRNVYL